MRSFEEFWEEQPTSSAEMAGVVAVCRFWAKQGWDDAIKQAEFYRKAIENCIDWANGHEWEWGDRAMNAFQFLHNALDGIQGNDPFANPPADGE